MLGCCVCAGDISRKFPAKLFNYYFDCLFFNMAFDWMRFVALLCIPHFYWIYCTLYYEIIIKKWISFVGISPSISFVHWRFCKPLANILALLAAMQKLFKHFFLLWFLCLLLHFIVLIICCLFITIFSSSFRDFLFGFV